MYDRSYRGHRFEEEFFGYSAHGAIFPQGRITYQNALEEVINNQPNNWNPRRPHTNLSAGICKKIVTVLNVRSGLELYVSLGTPLDFLYGIDGFFLYYGHVVTFDLTVSISKFNYKADVLITRKEITNGKAWYLAKKIARGLYPKRI